MACGGEVLRMLGVSVADGDVLQGVLAPGKRGRAAGEAASSMVSRMTCFFLKRIALSINSKLRSKLR